MSDEESEWFNVSPRTLEFDAESLASLDRMVAEAQQAEAEADEKDASPAKDLASQRHQILKQKSSGGGSLPNPGHTGVDPEDNNNKQEEELLTSRITGANTSSDVRAKFYTLTRSSSSSHRTNAEDVFASSASGASTSNKGRGGVNLTLRGRTRFHTAAEPTPPQTGNSLLERPSNRPPPKPPGDAGAAGDDQDDIGTLPIAQCKSPRVKGARRTVTVHYAAAKALGKVPETFNRSQSMHLMARSDAIWEMPAQLCLARMHDGYNMFEAPETMDNVRFVLDAKGQPTSELEAANVPKFIAALTLSEGSSDVTNVQSFFNAYSCLFGLGTFFSLLECRWRMEPPPDVAEDDVEQWTELVLMQVRLKIYALLHLFLKRKPQLFHKPDNVKLILDFASRIIGKTEGFEDVAKRIRAQVEAVCSSFFVENKRASVNLAKPPAPYVNEKAPSLATVHPTELARQITLMTYEIYNKITSEEMLMKRWQGETREKDAPNVLRMIEHTNAVTLMFVTEVLKEQDERIRAMLIYRLLACGRQFQKLNNYTGVMQVVAALKFGAVRRLKKSWANVPELGVQAWELLQMLMDSDNNYQLLRQRMEMRLPSIPFIGLYLSDCLFLQDGNPDFLPDSPGLLFVKKYDKIGEVISKALRSQNNPYCLVPIPKIQEFVTKGCENHWERSVMFARSKELEPRK